MPWFAVKPAKPGQSLHKHLLHLGEASRLEALEGVECLPRQSASAGVQGPPPPRVRGPPLTPHLVISKILVNQPPTKCHQSRWTSQQRAHQCPHQEKFKIQVSFIKKIFNCCQLQ